MFSWLRTSRMNHFSHIGITDLNFLWFSFNIHLSFFFFALSLKCDRACARTLAIDDFMFLFVSLCMRDAAEMCSLFFFSFYFSSEELVNAIQCSAQHKISTQYSRKRKETANVERVNTDNKKHNHKNNNNKTLNNFEILCQQTWLNRQCHTFDANEWLQWAMTMRLYRSFYWGSDHLESVRSVTGWLTGLAWLGCSTAMHAYKRAASMCVCVRCTFLISPNA